MPKQNTKILARQISASVIEVSWDPEYPDYSQTIAVTIGSYATGPISASVTNGKSIVTVGFPGFLMNQPKSIRISEIPPSGSAVIYEGIIPRFPVSISASWSTSDSVTLRWNPNGYSTLVDVTSNEIVSGPFNAGTSGSYTFNNLSQFSFHYFTLYNYSPTNLNVLAYARTSIAGLPPPVSPEISVTSVNDGKVSLSWNRISSALGYNILYSVGRDFADPVSVVTTTTSYDITGLSNGTTYYFKIVAYNENGRGPESSSVSAVPLPALLPPTTPDGVSVVSGDRTATVTWTPVDKSTQYKVYINTSSDMTTVNPVDTTNSSFIFNNLTNLTQYYVSVSATNSAGNSSPSRPVSFTPAAVVLGSPTGLIVMPDIDSFSASWSTISDATSYKFYYYAQSNPENVLSIESTIGIVTGSVSPGTSYVSYVVAINSDGVEGARSDKFSFTTKDVPVDNVIPKVTVPSRPENLTVVSDKGIIKISWFEVPEASSYIVLYTIDPDFKNNLQTVTTTKTSVDLDKLLDNTTYFFAVCGVNSSGKGELSNIAKIVTIPLNFKETLFQRAKNYVKTHPKTSGGLLLVIIALIVYFFVVKRRQMKFGRRKLY